VFVGHLAVALAAKKAEPKLRLPALVAATYGLDLLWPIFLLFGLETVRVDPGATPFTPLDFVNYPWSHSLLLALVWGALAGSLASMAGTVRMGVILGAVVVSHWVLDFVSHRPDMPLWPGGPLVGLGLWYSIPATIVVEGALLAIGLALYVLAAPARDRIGHLALWSFVLVTSAIWLSGPFSPPPPSVQAIAAVGAAGGIVFVLWAWWIERHRR
jgi:hypothetical protein